MAESCPELALARRTRTRAENLQEPRGRKLPGAWRAALRRALSPSPRARCAPRQERSGAQAAPRPRGPGHGGGLGVPAVSAPPPLAPAHLPPRPHSPAQPPGAPSRTRVASPSDRQKLGELASASRLPDLGAAARAGEPAGPPPSRPARRAGERGAEGVASSTRTWKCAKGCEADEERGNVNKVATAGGTPRSSIVAEDALGEGLAGDFLYPFLSHSLALF